jgi:AcrR family transcriptional regulator
MPDAIATQIDPVLTRRERRKIEMRERILEAAVALFDEHGFAATKVAEICEQADIAHKTFFNHFPSKQDLLSEIARVAIDRLLGDIEDTRKQPVSTRERLLYFFELIADNSLERGPMARELLTEVVHVSHDVGNETEQARKLYAAFGALIRDGLEAGDVRRQHDPDTLTEMVMGAFYVLMFNWANLDGYPIRERAISAAGFLADAITCTPANGHDERP